MDKFEEVTARVYLRNRRKAYEHFYFLQDLKAGDYVTTKNGIEKVERIEENSQIGSPLFDIAVVTSFLENTGYTKYAFSVEGYAVGIQRKLIRSTLGLYKNSKEILKVSKAAPVLYGNVPKS